MPVLESASVESPASALNGPPVTGPGGTPSAPESVELKGVSGSNGGPAAVVPRDTVVTCSGGVRILPKGGSPCPSEASLASGEKRRKIRPAFTATCRDDGYCSSSSTPKSSGQLSSSDGQVVKELEMGSGANLVVSLPGDDEDEEDGEGDGLVRGASVGGESPVASTPSLVRSPEKGDAVVVTTGPPPEEERPTWDKKTDFLLSIIGFAVDLANVWRFPYLCYRNGGGVFLIPYTLMLVFGALPLFYMELVLGQYNKQGPISIWKICPLFQGVGYCAVVVSWYVSFYYNVIICWAIYFMFSSFTSQLPWIQCGNEWNTKFCSPGVLYGEDSINGSASSNYFNGTSVYTDGSNRTSPALEFFHRAVLEIHMSGGMDDLGYPKWQLILCLIIVFIILYFSLFKGVSSSGKVVWVTATAPYAILTILLFRGMFLPGALEGVQYYLRPDVTKLLESQVWVDAAVQVFYSVGVGFGVHLTYASYNNFNNNCYRDCLLTTGVNSFTSFFSGFVIFVYLGYMSKKQAVPISQVATEGHGLVFQVYPEAISTLPGGQFWSVLFFIMLLTLGLDSAMGGLESVITGLMDEYKRNFVRVRFSRELFTAVILFLSFCVSIVNVTRGGGYVMYWFDTFAAGISLLCSALFESIGVAWIYGLDRFSSNIEEMMGFRPGIFWRVCWKIITPVFLLTVIGFGVANMPPLQYQDYMYPYWAVALGWGLALSSVAFIPLVALVQLCRAKGNGCKEKLIYTITPESERKPDHVETSRCQKKHWTYV